MIKDIINGSYDDKLDDLIEAIKQRRKIVRDTKAASTMAEVSVGDKVKLKGLSPKYLNGNVAEVLEKKNSKLECKFDKPVGKFPKGIPFRVPASCVEVLSD